MNLYCIYDRVAEEAGPLFEAVNDGVALRKYRQLMEGSPTKPEEFWLMHIGRYTKTSPIGIQGCELRQVIAAVPEGLELVKEKEA